MLQRGSGPVETYAFLCAVELEKGGKTTVEQVQMRLQDGLTWLEGTGKVEVESLAIIDVIDNESNS